MVLVEDLQYVERVCKKQIEEFAKSELMNLKNSRSTHPRGVRRRSRLPLRITNSQTVGKPSTVSVAPNGKQLKTFFWEEEETKKRKTLY